MIEGRINLYSDTQSRPTLAMRQAMLDAEVGDEQKGLDKSTNQLCEYVAELLGKEAAVFLPSGTMCNEIAIMVHCRPGEEIYAHTDSHILRFEGGGPAAFAGANIFPLQGDRGIYSAGALAAAIRPESRYSPTSRLVVVEQTANFGGGSIWTLDEIQAVTAVARASSLTTHLDGARLMNAVVASGVSAKDYCQHFDSAWVDLSKGLGCPIGGVLAGSKAFVDAAWQWKQRMGGAMRQSGMLAAAGLYAFTHHLEKLEQDHKNAGRLAEIIGRHPKVQLLTDKIETNIVLMDIADTGLSAYAVRDRLEQKGVNIGAFGESILRAITHLDVSAEMLEEAGAEFLATVDEMIEKA
ncbi:MAG: threonine aldolase [Cellvibrionaceae bacterium]|jgi:threonine aldolase